MNRAHKRDLRRRMALDPWLREGYYQGVLFFLLANPIGPEVEMLYPWP